jgi:hypothetical protein
MGTEGYILIVDKPSSIRIAVGANDKLGLWNGAMTVLQLLRSPDDSIFQQTIRDYPDQAFRGAYWLDVKLKQGSGLFDFTQTQQSQVDFLRRHKISTLFYQEPGA